MIESFENHPSFKPIPRHQTLSEAWKNPHPIYDRMMDRFNMVVRQLPADIQNSDGMKWLRFREKVRSAAHEVGAGTLDAFWMMFTWPVTATSPDLQHPNFKTEMLKASMPDMVGAKEQDGRVENVMAWITAGGQSRFLEDRMNDTPSHSNSSSSSSTSSSGGSSSGGSGA